MRRNKLKDVKIEIVPYDGTPNPRNPFDRLTPEDQRKKIVELYARICLRMLGKKAEPSPNPDHSYQKRPSYASEG